MLSPVYTGILIQILIQIGCVYTEANWIQIQTQTTSPMWILIQIWLRLHGGKQDSNPDSDHLSHVDSDPDSHVDSGCVYMEANRIQIQTQTTSPMWIVIQIRIRIRDLVLV